MLKLKENKKKMIISALSKNQSFNLIISHLCGEWTKNQKSFLCQQ